MMQQEAFLTALAAIVGPRGCVAPGDTEPYVQDWRGLYRGKALAVVKPGNTAEVAALLRLCSDARIAVVPQGGNTGMVGGSVPRGEGSEVVINLSRLNRIRSIDALDMTMTLEAGVTLKAAQEAAAAQNCKLPVSISSEGTAQIGGIIATNAGGNNTIRYGNTRDLLLGLEVVLPDGQVWNGLRRLRKDNAGYCLRQLIAGSEGTLGIITAATFQLTPAPLALAAALCALPSAEAALGLFDLFRRHDAAAVQAFEYMSAAGMNLVLHNIPDTRLPIASGAQHYVLVELASAREEEQLPAMIENVLEKAFARGIVQDAAIAQSEQQRQALWRLREEQSEAQRLAGPSIKNDVSVPLSRIPALLAEGTAASEAVLPGVRVVPFGHIGDGNIHFNVLAPVGMSAAEFAAHSPALTAAVIDVVEVLEGSFAAEHGVGQLKVDLLAARRSPVELGLMRKIRNAIDPYNLLNPGRVFAAE